MASVRKSRVSKRQQVITKSKSKALPVTDGLKSAETEKQYLWHFNTFKKWISARYSEDITDDKLKNEFEPDALENDFIEYLKYLQKDRGLQRSSVNSSMSSILHFCRVNSIWLHKERISMFVPEDENQHQDREYKRTEIERLLKESDKEILI
jgi:hypothetical protein